MYLMNVPPVAATQTEWRTCGPPGGYSLPICFNDSETELPTTGTPISDKVQMIIESLRSTQSSLEMGDEIEANLLSGEEGHSQVCKVQMGSSYAGAKSNTKGETPTENMQTADAASPVNQESSDSDSDDSVDKGIEEAILEYLKEKDDHKRKAELCFKFLQPSKIPRKSPPIPEVSKQNSDSSTLTIASNPFPKVVKAETLTAPVSVPLKKYLKLKASLNDSNTVMKLNSSKCTQTNTPVLPKEQTKSLSKTTPTVKNPVNVKEEVDSNDSSSDDGIEEAIQRYQLEKKEQQNNRDTFSPHAFKEDSDSTSDDGIEEAIRSFQLEQLKEKSVLNPFLHKQKRVTKSFSHGIDSTSVEHVKKHKLKKKKSRTEKEGKSIRPLPLFASVSKNPLSENSKGKGNGLVLFKVERAKEQPTAVPPKANTTAELMCAEAILDISKTVMPAAFEVGPSSCEPPKSLLPDKGLDEDSDGSSIDSEDGIEQEIRNFLEQKAQMKQQPPSSTFAQEPHNIDESEEMKEKQVVTEKKPSRLSLTQRRRREDNSSILKISATDNVTEAVPKTLHEHGKESSPTGMSQRSRKHPKTRLHVTEQSGEKSSSLDSDEDLDTAIKDLLKTKKKSKKKTRDLKQNSRKCLKDKELPQGSVSQTKLFKLDPISKRSTLKKVQKTKDVTKDKARFGKKAVLPQKQATQCEVHGLHEGEMEKQKAIEGQDTMLTPSTVKEDSSSVDSDDSIELEIRRFLAEKAKGPTAEKGKEGDPSSNGTARVQSPLQAKDVKEENQLAEIPISPFSVQSLLGSQSTQTSQRSLLGISMVGSQSRPSPVQSCSRFPEPADGDGSVKTEQRRVDVARGEVEDIAPQLEKPRPVLTPNAAHSRSESIKWRQSLGLPITDPTTVSQTSFHITSSKTRESSSATPSYQSRGFISPKIQTPVSAWSADRTNRAPFSSPTETAVNTKSRAPGLSLLSTARQRSMLSFTRTAAPDHRSDGPTEGDTQSMVHIPKDKSVFVELESNRTNHVQVQSREKSEGKERVDLLSEIKEESESGEINYKEVTKKEEEFIDEADCESSSRKNPEKKQGFSTLSLLPAIDPGFSFSPYIALNTVERSSMICRKNWTERSNKSLPSRRSARLRSNTVQCVGGVKRKLKFLLVNR